MSSSVTILIPTFNRARSLEAVWSSYISQEAVDKIVLVDDASTDDTQEVVHRLQDGPVSVEFVRNDARRGQQLSRMEAVSRARTEWVLFGEDDVYLGAGYVKGLLRCAEELQAGIVAGRCVSVLVPAEFDPTSLVDPRRQAHNNSIFDLARFEMDCGAVTSEPVRAPYLHSVAIIRRAIFDRTGFDPGYRGNACREETDFYLSAGRLGAALYFTPNVVCYHLRGPISAVGGQRINRLAVEYWNVLNTHRMVSKHWAYLKSDLGFRGTPMVWILGYVARRQIAQAKRLVSTRGRSSFRG